MGAPKTILYQDAALLLASRANQLLHNTGVIVAVTDDSEVVILNSGCVSDTQAKQLVAVALTIATLVA